jgi:tRNA-intron endonuclease
MVEQVKRVVAELIGNRLIVWDTDAGSQLYEMGFYGKPVGISKPKTNAFDAPLILGLIEGFYLLKKKRIKIQFGIKKRSIGIKRLEKYAKKTYKDFSLHYLVYKDLRDHGYIVLPGIKFGCEYAIYERGPGIDHSPYLVSVKSLDEDITSTDIVRAGRLATSVRKKFIIAVPNLKTNQIRYMMFNWFKA